MYGNLEIVRIMQTEDHGKTQRFSRTDFIFIMRQTRMTKRDVSGNPAELENATYIKVKKRICGQTPTTMLSMTEKG